MFMMNYFIITVERDLFYKTLDRLLPQTMPPSILKEARFVRK